MVTMDHDDLDRILDDLEPDHIPVEFVAGAKVTDSDGDTYTVSTEELEDIMMDEESLDDQGIALIQLILDLEQVKASIMLYSRIILSSVKF